jgi:hypothetical protein
MIQDKNKILVILKPSVHKQLWQFRLDNQCRSLNEAVRTLLEKDEQSKTNTR